MGSWMVYRCFRIGRSLDGEDLDVTSSAFVDSSKTPGAPDEVLGSTPSWVGLFSAILDSSSTVEVGGGGADGGHDSS